MFSAKSQPTKFFGLAVKLTLGTRTVKRSLPVNVIFLPVKLMI